MNKKGALAELLALGLIAAVVVVCHFHAPRLIKYFTEWGERPAGRVKRGVRCLCLTFLSSFCLTIS